MIFLLYLAYKFQIFKSLEKKITILIFLHVIGLPSAKGFSSYKVFSKSVFEICETHRATEQECSSQASF